MVVRWMVSLEEGTSMAAERTTELRNEAPSGDPTFEGMLDLEFEAFCEREADEDVTLDEVREATAGIAGSMAEAIVEEERADRI